MIITSQQKVKELTIFLSKYEIGYEEIIVSSLSKLLLSSDTYITLRTKYNNKLLKLGIDVNVFEEIKNHLAEISYANDFDNNISLTDKSNLNDVLNKVCNSIKNKVKLNFIGNDDFGGYTDSRRSIVIYNPPRESVEQYLKIVPGITYHEMGHILFTCSFRVLGDNIKHVMPNYEKEWDNFSVDEQTSLVSSILKIVNVLEDGRMENLMAKRYGICETYFKDTIFNFVINMLQEKLSNSEKITAVDCALIVGRKYIKREVRKWIIDKYIETNTENSEEDIKRIVSYVNKFVTLSWSKDYNEMMYLAIGFFYEFVKPELENMDNQMSNWGDGIDKIIVHMTEQNDMDFDDDERINETEEHKAMRKLFKQMIDEKNSDQEETEDDVDETIKSERKQIEEEKQEKLKTLEREFDSTKSKDKINNKFYVEQVDLEMLSQRSALEKKLKQYIRECRNGYRTKVKKGTVDIGEARRQQYRGGTRIFKQYKTNTRKALDIDVAFVLDCSYSMSDGCKTLSKIKQASRQLWISAQACSSVGANVKVFTFSDMDLGILEDHNEKNKYKIPKYINGTVISNTLFKAENYLNCSKKNTKWLIVLTDGEISDSSKQEMIISRMKKKNIICGKINLTDGGFNYNKESDKEYSHVVDYKYKSKGLQNNFIVSFFEEIYYMSMKGI